MGKALVFGNILIEFSCQGLEEKIDTSIISIQDKNFLKHFMRISPKRGSLPDTTVFLGLETVTSVVVAWQLLQAISWLRHTTPYNIA